jgi:hypothetical protein
MKPTSAFIYVLVAATAGAAAGAVAGWRAAHTVSQRYAAAAKVATGPRAIPNLKGMTRQQVLDAVEGSGVAVTFETDPREHRRAAVGGGGIVTGWSSPAIGAVGPIPPGTPLLVRLSPE